MLTSTLGTLAVANRADAARPVAPHGELAAPGVPFEDMPFTRQVRRDVDDEVQRLASWLGVEVRR